MRRCVNFHIFSCFNQAEIYAQAFQIGVCFYGINGRRCGEIVVNIFAVIFPERKFKLNAAVINLSLIHI